MIDTAETSAEDLAIGYKELQALGKPPDRNFYAHYAWMWGKPPLGEGYNDYIRHKDDMLDLKSGRLSFFDNFIEEHIHTWPLSMIKVRTPT